MRSAWHRSIAAAAYTLTAVIAVGCINGAHESRAEQQPAAKDQSSPSEALASKAAKLIAAYPDWLDRLEGGMLVWKKDGEQMRFDDGKASKDFKALLNNPDIEDQLALGYIAGSLAAPPAIDFDPGRFRNEAFFKKMYGDCEKDEVRPHLAIIDWLPKKGGGKLAVTTVNGVDEKLKAVSDELDALPDKFTPYLIPSAGVYNCRNIAGSNLKSVHAYGAAIDINAAHSDYWLWSKQDGKGGIPYRNRVPDEIVEVFERHGFIWGGKWYHFDTMHFEYRPELLSK